MVIVFGIGYLSASFGLIGVAFIIGEYDTCCERKLGENLIYKETGLGNEVSNYRGKKVEVYKTISFLPVIEWRIYKKDYYDVKPYVEPLIVEYNSIENEIYLSVNDSVQEQWGEWRDTINVKNTDTNK